MALVDARFTILGPTGIRVGDDVDTQWGPLKERAVLAVLLTRPGASVPASELIDWVWSDERELPKNPSHALHLYSSRIRNALESLPNRVELSVSNGAYRLNVPRSAVDYFQFRDHLDRARELARGGAHQQALTAIRSAFTIWQHQVPLEDLKSDRAASWRRNAQLNQQIPAYNLLCGELLVLGEYNAVLEALDDLEPDYLLHPVLLKRRLDALHRLMRTDEATQLYLSMHKAFRVDRNDVAADDLRKFHDKLQEHGVAHVEPAAGTANVPAPQQLPLDVPLFVGHEDKLAALDAMATQPGVVVVSGSGGVGKTALTVHWAHTRRSSFPGVLFVDLQGFSDGAVLDASSVVDRFLQGLGVPPDRIANPEHRLAKLQSLLSGRRLLVVLDNVRDVDQIHRLLPLFSSCVVVVTSRSKLSGLAARLAPRRIPIGPLEAEEASRLLLDRIGERIGSGGELVELTRVCGGLPIALKVLANHIATRPGVRLGAFVDHFRERGVLDIGTMHGPRAVFMQSLRALEPDAHFLFRTIGAHPGPDISVSAAAAMASLPVCRVQEALDALVEAHLLEQAGELDRFKLHDLLREFSAGLLEDPGERTVVEHRMLDFYLRTAENADVRVLPAMVRVPTPDAGNDVRAIEFCDAASAHRWCTAEARNIVALVRFAIDAGHFEYAMQIPQLVGQIWLRQGLTAEVLDLLHAGLAAARSLGKAAEIGAADLMQQIGHTYLLRQEYGRAEHYVHSAHLGYLRAGGNQTSGIAICLHTGARILVATGNIPMGLDSHIRALALVRQLGESGRGLERIFLFRTGEAYQKAFEYEQAASYYHQALSLAQTQGDEASEATILQLLGSLSFARERTAEARAFAEDALRKHARQLAIGRVGEVCALLSQVEAEAGNSLKAKQYARQAIRFCGRAGASLSEATALCVLGRILGQADQRDGAVEALERAEAILLDLDPDRAGQVTSELRHLRAEIDIPAARVHSPVVERGSEVRRP
ncbi:NB-ARC domain-containing protein [Lentzea sp. BCCO 10_0798]|uniref:NB-ARC domain-containing protein n=1 Tax=Lentzea kristufekii TaxID=3095430 RepID=A0ABU4TZD1_9PSEU|nr:NB-ARC domain-containing protein [Lentzea sp. BCCO 10_0798]MDX8053520.1 NB-ARC domain-containing protein [Lentzea sp. BCCO 10_0798]